MLKKEEIEKLSKLLVIAPVEKIYPELFKIIEKFDDRFTILINVNKPVAMIKSKIDNPNCLFIDGISENAKPHQGDVAYVGFPSIENIDQNIVYFTNKIEKGVKRVIIIDSLSTFLIYNNVEWVVDFTKRLMEKADEMTKIIIFVPEEKDRTLFLKIGGLFEKVEYVK